MSTLSLATSVSAVNCRPTGGSVGPIRGTINVTVPLGTWLADPANQATPSAMGRGRNRLARPGRRDGREPQRQVVHHIHRGGRPPGRPWLRPCRAPPVCATPRSRPGPRAGPGIRPRDRAWTFTVTPLGLPSPRPCQRNTGLPAVGHPAPSGRGPQPTCGHPGCRPPATCCGGVPGRRAAYGRYRTPGNRPPSLFSLV